MRRPTASLRGGRSIAVPSHRYPPLQAVKAIAIGRSYLREDKLDMLVSPTFVHLKLDEDDVRSGMRLAIKKVDGAAEESERFVWTGAVAVLAAPSPPPNPNPHPHPSLNGEELRVAGHSVPSTLAGAIAMRVRDAKPVALVAVGPQAVNQSLKAIAIARKYLENDKVDVDIRVQFVHLSMGEEERSGLKLTLVEFKTEA